MRVVERLFGAGFRPIAIPPYESALIMRKGECVALLGPVENGGLKLLAPVDVFGGWEFERAVEEGFGGCVCVEEEGSGGDGGDVEGVGGVSDGVDGHFGSGGEKFVVQS